MGDYTARDSRYVAKTASPRSTKWMVRHSCFSRFGATSARRESVRMREGLSSNQCEEEIIPLSGQLRWKPDERSIPRKLEKVPR